MSQAYVIVKVLSMDINEFICDGARLEHVITSLQNFSKRIEEEYGADTWIEFDDRSDCGGNACWGFVVVRCKTAEEIARDKMTERSKKAQRIRKAQKRLAAAQAELDRLQKND